MRILLAEDEHSLSRAVCALLERNNYSVDAVYDGEAALDFLDGGNYDAVILDIMMPKLDGLEVLRRLREKGNTIPVLLLTARSEVEDKVTGLDMGANDYLTKPFSTAELTARIRAMTRSATGGHVTSRLSLGNVTLDQTSFELSSPPRQLPAGQQRIPDDGTAAAQPTAAHFHRTVPRTDLGL